MYLDSGSGSMLVSAVVAGAAGAGVVAKVALGKLTGGFRKSKTADLSDLSANTDTEQG